MNFLRQGFRKLSSKWHADRQTDRHDRNYVPRRLLGGQQEQIALFLCPQTDQSRIVLHCRVRPVSGISSTAVDNCSTIRRLRDFVIFRLVFDAYRTLTVRYVSSVPRPWLDQLVLQQIWPPPWSAHINILTAVTWYGGRGFHVASVPAEARLRTPGAF